MDSDFNIQYNKEKGTEKDNLIETIINDIKLNKNGTFKCKIVKEEINEKEKDYIFMSIESYNINYTQFIRKYNGYNFENKYISFEIKDIKLKLINGKHYLYLEDFNILKNETYKLKETYEFNSIEEITDNNILSTIKLKAKEISDNLILTKFIFQDLNYNNVTIEYNEDYEFEHGKIYLFNGYLYDKSQQKLISTMFSTIQEYSNNINTLNIFNCEEDKLVSFKCIIKSFSLIDKFIIVEDSDKKNYKVKVNYSLLKKISLNGINYFYNFVKVNSGEFVSTNFSDIDYKEETHIKFIFDNFDLNKNFYNRISINNNHYDIKEKIMVIKIEEENKNNLFNQDIYYERIENKTVCHKYKFSLEVEKGKKNNFHSLLDANGNHSYQFYFQARYKEDLPKSISINVNNNKYDFNNPDNFGNDLIERFTIINIPEQDVITLLDLPTKTINYNFQDNKINDFKYLISINDKHKKDYKIFIKNKVENKKEDFHFPEKDYEIIKKIFNENINDEQIEYKNMQSILSSFLLKNINEIENISNILSNGFNKYKFKNNRKDYEAIKYLSFIDLCFKNIFLKNHNTISIYFYNLKGILNSIINLEYIDRIKVLLSFITNFNENIKLEKNENTLIYDKLELFDLDKKDCCDLYPYVKQAYQTLYEIIDNLKEECPLYQGISKLNSIINSEITSNNILHSGSLLNVGDIKLELIKNINTFVLLSFKENIFTDDYAEYFSESKTTRINILSLFNKVEDIYNEKYYKNAASSILILFIHENFGHIKKNINNENDLSPRNHDDNNFNEFSLTDGDSGDALEFLLINDSFNINYIMMHNSSEKLLNANLYINDNLVLREIYNKITTEMTIKMKINEIEEEKLKKEEDKVENNDNDDDIKDGEKNRQQKKKEKEKNNKKEYICKEESEEAENIIIQKKEIEDDDNRNFIKEEIYKIIFKDKYDNNQPQKMKKHDNIKKLREKSSPPRQKRMLFRDMKRIYGRMTSEEKKKLKNDENYKRYLKLLKNTRVKY